MINLSVVIPAFNEEGNIDELIKRCMQVFPAIVGDFEILIINDGSGDQTGEKAQELASIFANVRVFNHTMNQGMGAAVATGFANARYDFVCTVPADLQFDIKELTKILSLAQTSDIVASYRISRDYNLYRWMLTYSYIFLLRLMFGLHMKDPNWVKLFRKKALQSLPITSRRFFWDAEVLIQAKKQGMRIAEVGVHWYPRRHGKSSAIGLGAAAKTFLELVRFWLGGK